MGFCLLVFLLGVQHPMEMGAYSGWGVKFPRSNLRQVWNPKSPCFWMGFWVLGFLLGFQPPMGMGTYFELGCEISQSTQGQVWNLRH